LSSRAAAAAAAASGAAGGVGVEAAGSADGAGYDDEDWLTWSAIENARHASSLA
jgi:hypothetical protein